MMSEVPLYTLNPYTPYPAQSGAARPDRQAGNSAPLRYGQVGLALGERAQVYSLLQDYLADEQPHSPPEPHRALGIVLLQGPTGRRFLMSEVHPYSRA